MRSARSKDRTCHEESGGNRALPTPWHCSFGHRIAKEYISIALRHELCIIESQQPQSTILRVP